MQALLVPLLMATLGSVATLVMTLAPADDDRIGVLFAPWSRPSDNIEAVTSEGGLVMNAAHDGRVLAVRMADPRFKDRIRSHAGVVAVIGTRGLSGCTSFGVQKAL